MDSGFTDKITAFDTLFTTNHIQMLKILLPFLNPGAQKHLAVYIKFLELRYTLLFFQSNPNAAFPEYGPVSRGTPESADSAVEICNEILPFCSPDEKEKLQNIINLCQNIKNLQEMMQIMEMMQDVFPDLAADAGDMDLAQTVEMLQGMFAQ